MDNHQLQLWDKADVFWKISKGQFHNLPSLLFFYSIFILKVLAWSMFLVQVVFIITAISNRLGHRKILKMVHVKIDLLSKDPRPLRMKGLLIKAMIRKQLRNLRITMKRRKMKVNRMRVIQVWWIFHFIIMWISAEWWGRSDSDQWWSCVLFKHRPCCIDWPQILLEKFLSITEVAKK